MDDLLSEFLAETTEGLTALDIALVELEQRPGDRAILATIFRIVHTIKGTCGFLSLSRLEAVAHAGENVLGQIRDGKLAATPAVISLVLAAIDRIKTIVAALEAGEGEPAGDDRALIAELARAVEPASEPAVPSAPIVAAAADADADADAPTRRPAADGANAEPAPTTPPPATRAAGLTHTPDLAAAVAAMIHAAGATEAADEAAPQVEARDTAAAGATIRVKVEVLESLMTTVSELVLTRNQLTQIARSQADSEFTMPLQRLSAITTELQEGIVRTRMQPIQHAWSALPRLLRDLSRDLKKKIHLKMVGADTELDRQVLDLVKDPLTHMVRNSADHGIELPAQRLAAGKPEYGTITLNAFQESGHIVIEVSDDGRGIDTARVRRKLVENGMLSEVEIAWMGDEQINQYIFRPGFSTAAAVTSVSGRGVGMDVVMSNIAKIGGTVEALSAPGRGSTVVLRIPLTLAIVSALIVESGDERFAVQQLGVVEVVRTGDGSEYTIERFNGQPILRLRDTLLPLIELRDVLKLSRRKTEGGDRYIVVMQIGAYRFGMIVDRVHDTEEIVVKPMSPILRSLSVYAGLTILGDGAVIMILDPAGVAAAAGKTIEDRVGDAAPVETAEEADEADANTLLIFRAGSGALKAVPLSQVARLEEIDRQAIEMANDRPVIQYRGGLIPVVPIDGRIDIGRAGLQPLLVFADGERRMALMVDEIIDIVEGGFEVQLASGRPGVLGCAVIAGAATDLVDTAWFLTQAHEEWFGASLRDLTCPTHAETKVLLVDDSVFFRNLMVPVLKAAGYRVSAVASAERALDLARRGDRFAAIVSDLQMPGMGGFEFARTVRDGSNWSRIPMLALAADGAPETAERALAAGFTDFMVKFDRDRLLRWLAARLDPGAPAQGREPPGAGGAQQAA